VNFLSDTPLLSTLIVGALALLASTALCFTFFGAPKFIDNWVLRQTWDGEAALKYLVRQQAKGQIAQEKFDEVFTQIQEVFGEKMKEVERHIKLHDSIDARRARVARRRPLQRKLGRIA
jgi:hypothetical protein